MSLRSEHRTARSARRTSSREAQSTAATARTESTNSPTPARPPRPLKAATSSASAPTTASPVAVAGSDTLEHSALAHPYQVLVDLEHRAERFLERRRGTDG